MPAFLHSLPNVLFTIFFFGFCIFIHELGHLLAALWRGLKVERFSLGFGPKIWGTTFRGVEYVICAVPFGGYVALPQIDHSADQPQASDGTPLPRAKPLDRIITAFAGPLFNIIAGFALATIVMWGGIMDERADKLEVLRLPTTSPEYVAGLRPGDVITAVNGKSFKKGWMQIAERILLSKECELTVKRGTTTQTFIYEPEPNPDPKFKGYRFPQFEVFSPVFVRGVNDGSPAMAAGLRVDDELLRVNGVAVENDEHFGKLIRATEGKEIELVFRRAGQEQTVQLRARQQELKDKDNKVVENAWIIGVKPGSQWVLVHPSPWEQFTDFFERTRATLVALGQRTVGARDMGGPITIVSHTFKVAQTGGFLQALAFIVFINFSLGTLNLFPIPVLDGGHILISLVEMVTRRPLPSRFVNPVQIGFAVLLIGFMLYVTVFDIKRLETVQNLINKFSSTESRAAPATTGAAPAAKAVLPSPAADTAADAKNATPAEIEKPVTENAP